MATTEDAVSQIDYNRYSGLSGVNWSTLSSMQKSPAHYRERLATPSVMTPAMAIGRLIHTAVLEPEKLDDEYAIWIGGRRGTNDYKLWLSEVAGARQPVTKDEYDTALAVSESVWRHRTARKVLTGGRVESTMMWIDPKTRIRCKARPDHIRGRNLTDLKSTTTVDARDFGRATARLSYYGQLAFYLRGVTVTKHVVDPVARIIAVEKEPPYDVAVFRVPDHVLYEGEQLINKLLDQVVVCRRRRSWPGRYKDEQTLDFPNWALSDDNAYNDAIEVLE